MMSFSAVWLNSVTGTGNTMVNLTIEAITIIVYSIYVYLTLETWNLPITWGWGSELVLLGRNVFPMSYWYMKSGRWKAQIEIKISEFMLYIKSDLWNLNLNSNTW